MVFYGFEINDKEEKREMELEEGEELISGKWLKIDQAVKSMVHESEVETVKKLQKLVKIFRK